MRKDKDSFEPRYYHYKNDKEHPLPRADEDSRVGRSHNLNLGKDPEDQQSRPVGD